MRWVDFDDFVTSFTLTIPPGYRLTDGHGLLAVSTTVSGSSELENFETCKYALDYRPINRPPSCHTRHCSDLTCFAILDQVPHLRAAACSLSRLYATLYATSYQGIFCTAFLLLLVEHNWHLRSTCLHKHWCETWYVLQSHGQPAV